MCGKESQILPTNRQAPGPGPRAQRRQVMFIFKRSICGVLIALLVAATPVVLQF